MMRAMPRSPHAVTLSLTLLALCATSIAARADSQTTYKWVDDQGVTHYGDSIPPQYAQKAST